MLAELHSFIAERRLIGHGEKILLAVSGGVDSMVMAHLFLHMPFDTGIAHCNFSLRGKESDMDEEFVRKFSEDHKIPFFTARFDTKSFARDKGISVQMAARELRYSWFEEIRKTHGFDKIAIAHNLNDNIETMLLNLVRGTGLAGLSGMKVMSGSVIRPLLFATRERIEKYSSAQGITFREDRSNADTKYTRNKIRHKIIPVLQEINPSLLKTLSGAAVRSGELNEIVAEYIAGLYAEMTIERDGATVFKLNSLRKHEGNRTVIFELFRPFGLNSLQIYDLLNIMKGKTGSWIFTGTHRIVKNRNELIVTGPVPGNDFRLTIYNIDEFPENISAEYLTGKSFRIPADPLIACLDTEKLRFPLVIRKWNAGDFFYPLGMNGKKKLSDYFIDKKYSLPEKERKMVLESEGKIVWIIGDRIDDRFKVTADTSEVLLLTEKPRKEELRRKEKGERRK